jgi:DMSO/TMAO reductase YedYZ heme-binding membrane subunit
MKKNITNNEGRGIWAWDIVKIITLFSIVLFLFIFYSKGFNEDSNRIVIRLTARMSGILFCLAFGASVIHAWLKNSFSWWVFMNRKFWGISFAIMHLVHLAFLVLLQQYFHPVFERAATTSLLAGGLVYLFLVLMLLTSFSFFANKITTQRWKILHTAGGYWIWLIFMISYVKRVIRGSNEYIPLVVLFAIILLLRIWKLWKK